MASRVFAMPDLGEGLEEGTVVAWLVAEGDDVSLNQPLVEVETAKAAVEVPSPVAGRVTALHAAEGDDVAVGAPLVTFEVAAAEDAGAPGPPPERPAAAAPGPTAAVRTRAGVGADETVRATPAVRRLAKDLGVDLRLVGGTGPGGRATADDVRAAAAGEEGEEGEEAGMAGEAGEGVERMPVTATRRAIAENLERQATIPQVTTFRTLDCEALEAFRREREVSPLAVVVAAVAATARAHPLLNAAWADDAILLRAAVHVGVAADTERGLVVPVLRDAGSIGIAAIAAGIRRLAEGARAGTLRPEDLAGATIAVSNTGSYGSEAGTPILSPGTSATLAFGAIAPRALVVDGSVVARPAATISLTFDHRVLDGAAAGRALTDLVDRLRSAERLRDLPG